MNDFLKLKLKNKTISCVTALIFTALLFSACERNNLWKNPFSETENSIADVSMVSSESADSRITFYWDDPVGTVIQEIRITCTRILDSVIIDTAIACPGVENHTFSGLTNDTDYSINIVVINNFGDTSNGITFIITPRSVASANYFIYTANDLDAVRGSALPQYTNWDLSDTYNLMADLDLSAYNWVPLGDGITPFTGTFEGNGHTISNLTITNTANYNGLFGYVNNITGTGGNIHSLQVTGNVSGGYYTGGLAGYLINAAISECSFNGSVTGTFYVGGLAGDVNGGIITGSNTSGSVENTGDYTGGLIGQNGGPVDDCHATGRVTGGGNYVGGLVGQNSANITGCIYANTTYAITSTAGAGANYIGGLAGQHITGTISNSHATADIIITTGTNINYVGGFAGAASGTINDTGGACYSTGTITITAALDTADDYCIGGFIGYSTELTLTGAYSSVNIDVQYSVPSAGTYTACIGGLIGQASDTMTAETISASYSQGSVTASITGTAGTRRIYTGGLTGNNEGGNFSNCYYNGGTVDISASDAATVLTGGLVGYNPSGSIDSCHSSGTVIGDSAATTATGGLIGYNFSSITASYSTADVSGDTETGGLIGNNTVAITTACSASGVVTGTGTAVGGFAGRNSAALAGCSATGLVTGTSNIGGLIGSNTGAITGCWAEGQVNATNGSVGGLIGYNNAAVVSNSHAVGDVETTGVSISNIGGLIGRNVNSDINGGSYASGDVSGINAHSVGGLIGIHEGGTISGNSFSTGSVTGTSGTGGLIGQLSTGTVTGCYHSTGTTTGSTNAGGLVGSNSGTINGGSYSSAAVTGSSCTGGLVGSNSGNITGTAGTECYATGDVTGTGTSEYTGGLVGYNYGTIVFSYVNSNTISGYSSTGGFVGVNEGNITDSSVIITTILDGEGNTGGFAGYSLGTINHCGSSCDVNGTENVGGFIGENGDGSGAAGIIQYCDFNGNVTGTASNVGGFVGLNREGTITESFTGIGIVDAGNESAGGFVCRNMALGVIGNCYSRCDVYGNDYVGGFVGYTLTGSSITNCYSTGYVDQSGMNFGGFAANTLDPYLACFYDGNYSGYYANPGIFVAAATPATTVQMQTQGTFDPPWDFTNPTGIWIIDLTMTINNGYPYLRNNIP
ncbi:MAG: hypothetical protein JW864_10670 [Spirochaetes bacterium]|nr:hypothetical protein [Spirochaetota bacterium]